MDITQIIALLNTGASIYRTVTDRKNNRVTVEIDLNGILDGIESRNAATLARMDAAEAADKAPQG